MDFSVFQLFIWSRSLCRRSPQCACAWSVVSYDRTIKFANPLLSSLTLIALMWWRMPTFVCSLFQKCLFAACEIADQKCPLSAYSFVLLVMKSLVRILNCCDLQCIVWSSYGPNGLEYLGGTLSSACGIVFTEPVMDNVVYFCVTFKIMMWKGHGYIG